MADTIAAKVGAVAAGTTANLAQGAWDVAKSKVADITEAAPCVTIVVASSDLS